MACCGRRRQTTTGGEQVGYYVILPDGTEVPEVSKGAAPFISYLEAQRVIARAAIRDPNRKGGTIRTLRRKPAK